MYLYYTTIKFFKITTPRNRGCPLLDDTVDLLTNSHQFCVSDGVVIVSTKASIMILSQIIYPNITNILHQHLRLFGCLPDGT